MDTLLNDLNFVVAYLNDILMNCQNVEQHKEHVHKVFLRIQEYGFKLKEAKYDFFMEKIEYLGHIIHKDSWTQTQNGLPQSNMPAPENISSFQSFLGPANYYQVFIPNMHNLHAPLNELLKRDKDWEWTPECQEAFVKIKEVLTSDLFLTHYNLNVEHFSQEKRTISELRSRSGLFS